MSHESAETEAASTGESPRYRVLRCWPPVLLIVLMVVARYFSVWFPELPMVWAVGAFVPALLGLLLLLWWLTLSRANWLERFLGLGGTIAALVAVAFLLHPTMRGAPQIVLTMPTTIAAFGLVLTLLGRWQTFQRTTMAVAAAWLMAGFSLLLQNAGATGDFSFGFDWRWQPSAEDIFLAQRASATNAAGVVGPTAESLQSPPWPGFRGSLRDGVQSGFEFASTWRAEGPAELWRIKVGPAWSSFAVAEGFLFTQEQRGAQESVVCYAADSGQEVWAHDIESRFFDELGGLGPRATPTLDQGHLYALGAAGWLLKLDARTGERLWQVNLGEITGQSPPMWGYSCSPLVMDDVVMVHAVGPADLGVIAFDCQTGQRRWSCAADKDSYSSLHPTQFFGQQQVVFVGGSGVKFIAPKTGSVLHEHSFPIAGYRAVQPAVVDADKLLFTSEYAGSRLIQLQASETEWTSKELWTTRNLKPDFNDFVIHGDAIYGFDGNVFACIDLATGQRNWKSGRYGKGQVILLAASDLLLVISEMGELVLLQADPREHVELATLQALPGKTWNHPVVVGDRLYLRNAGEAVCYRLPTKSADVP